MSRPAPRRRASEFVWRLPCMLAVALVTANYLSAVEHPRAQARSGPIAVRVTGVDAPSAANLARGLAELRQRLNRLRRAMAHGELDTWTNELEKFDRPLAGWTDWPTLRTGGCVPLEFGAEVFEWPATTAAAFGLGQLDPSADVDAACTALDRARETAAGLLGALGRLR